YHPPPPPKRNSRGGAAMIALAIVAILLLLMWDTTKTKLEQVNVELEEEAEKRGKTYNPDVAAQPGKDAAVLILLTVVLTVVVFAVLGSLVPVVTLLPK